MSDLSRHGTPRRGFLQRLAAASLAVGLGQMIPARAAAAARAGKRVEGEGDDVEQWPGRLAGRHRQLFDAVSPNEGYALAFTTVFLDTNNTASRLPDRDLDAVVVLRHHAALLALDDAIWAKYQLGESASIDDPATRLPAARNIFYHPRPGDLRSREMGIDRLLARGVIFGVCGVALRAMAAGRAPTAGVSAEAAHREWLAHVISGCTVIPSGVWGVNRGQEHGCTYCYTG